MGGESKTNRQKDELTVAQAGRRGGQSTLEHRGVEFYREIGRRGGQRTAELYRELLSEFGKKGGRPRRPNLEDSLEEERRLASYGSQQSLI